ncbi:MAG: DUF58 domain-containing protein [Ruminococcus sp.]|nr:DUF58 domain-containing protein [Ruminococcus sp.]MDE6784619.1 DUF58 domain-containing protein [Ruminococcus sp.]
MLFIKIFFAVLIIVCIVFYIMYLWDFALVLLIVMAVLPVIMFISTYAAKKMIDIDFAVKDNTAAKKENFPIQLKVLNRSIIPIGKAEVHIEYCNIFSGETGSFTLLIPVQARNVQSVSFQLSSRFCGIVKVRCAYIDIFDPLRIFRFRAGSSIQTEISIMPEGLEISGRVSSTDRLNDESSVFSEYAAGDDPSEIFDLRNYNQGDRLNRIHWKLSLKKDEFIVKDYSLPVDIPCTIFLNLRCSEKSVYTLPVFDTLIETFVSMSQFLIENERVHTVVYYNFKAGNFVEVNIDSSDSLAYMIRELLISLSDTLECGLPEEYFIERENFSLSSFIFISPEVQPAVMEFIEGNIDADIKNALIVVKSQEDAAKIQGYSTVNTIPVIIGRIRSSIRDIEV